MMTEDEESILRARITVLEASLRSLELNMLKVVRSCITMADVVYNHEMAIQDGLDPDDETNYLSEDIRDLGKDEGGENRGCN